MPARLRPSRGREEGDSRDSRRGSSSDDSRACKSVQNPRQTTSKPCGKHVKGLWTSSRPMRNRKGDVKDLSAKPHVPVPKARRCPRSSRRMCWRLPGGWTGVRSRSSRSSTPCGRRPRWPWGTSLARSKTAARPWSSTSGGLLSVRRWCLLDHRA